MEALADSALAKVGKTGIVVEADQTLQEMARRYKAISDRLTAEDEAKKRLAGQIASWITAQGATKVQHDLGTFTYQKPEPKPEKQVFNAEKAWDSLMDSFRPGMPSMTSDELLALAEEIQAEQKKEKKSAKKSSETADKKEDAPKAEKEEKPKKIGPIQTGAAIGCDGAKYGEEDKQADEDGVNKKIVISYFR